MIQVYVTKMPENETECPFYNKNNNKCNITNDKCDIKTEKECKHLMTLYFDFGDNNE